jgi:hypothetical protein
MHNNPRRREYELTCDCGARFVTVWSGMGGTPSCKECTDRKAAGRQARKNAVRLVENNPGRRRYNMIQNLRRYGLTITEHEAMVTAQGNRCAICGDPPDPNGVRASSRLHVDHDHDTGVVRGLLCNRCNQGVGYFRDEARLMLRAAQYIEEHRKA